MAHQPRQFALNIRTWGGRRRGAGRKPTADRHPTPHRKRATHDPHCPVHVTLRARRGLSSLRDDGIFCAVRGAFAAASRNGFRLLHYSVQSDHLHLVVEADEPTRLSRGVQGLAIRVARAINRVLRRHGRVWDERFHAHTLRRPREVRNALVYVLNNCRKHLRAVAGLDPCSSAAWFDGWRTTIPAPAHGASVVAAHTWLARVGWRRHGLLEIDEAPGERHRRSVPPRSSPRS